MGTKRDILEDELKNGESVKKNTHVDRRSEKKQRKADERTLCQGPIP